MDLQGKINRWDLYAWELDDENLLKGIKRLCVLERRVQYKFLCYLYAIYDKKVYAKEGFPSLPSFFVGYLGYSEESARKRSQIVVKASRVPQLYMAIKHRRLSMTAAQKLCPYIDIHNANGLIAECAGKSVREVERVIVKQFPLAAFDDRVRQRVAPLSVDEVSVYFSASTRWAKKLEKLQALLSHKHPQGKVADITEEAFDLLIEKLEGKKTAKKVTRVTSGGSEEEVTRVTFEKSEGPEALDSRHVPKNIERALWERDDSRCTFVSKSGRRCEARRFLQIDHIKPWALGGSSHDLDNLRLLCSTHNKLRAKETYPDDAWHAFLQDGNRQAEKWYEEWAGDKWPAAQSSG